MSRRIVIKVGSSSLTYENGTINYRFLGKFIRVLSDIHNSGIEIVLVTSGAVSVGVGKLSLKARPKDMPTKQAAAAVGQCELMAIYDRFFTEYGQTVAQILLTKDVIDNDVTCENATNTFMRLLSLGSIPIVNENDTISTKELAKLNSFGDNDTLSAMVATIIKADTLIIMSDIDGLYDSNPRKNAAAKLIETVNEMSDELLVLADGSGSTMGTGGMATKLEAAKMAFEHNFDMFIINSADPSLLYKVIEEGIGGTHFKGRKNV